MTGTPGARYVRGPNVQFRALEDNTFLIDPQTGTIHHLNPLGAAIWRQLDEPVTVAELADLLSAAFPQVTRVRIACDIEALIAALETERLVIAEAGT